MIQLVDVFTDVVGRGNRAGVVLDASGLSKEEMQAIAARADAGETAFGLPSDRPREYDLEVRYFSKVGEIPLCGHATIAFHYARARKLDLAPRSLRVKTGAGVLVVDVERADGDHRVVMTQGAPRVVSTLTPDSKSALLDALALREDDLVAGLPIQHVTTGHGKVMIPIRTYAALGALRPDFGALASLSPRVGANGFFVFTRDAQRPDVLYHGRMFAPVSGVDEDPVTGNANGPAGFYLVTHGAVRADDSGTLRYRALQGEAMGRPGVIEVVLTLANGAVSRVQITGRAMLVP